MAIASDRDSTTVRTEGGKEDVMVSCEGVEAVLTVKGQDKIFSGAGRPATTKKTERGFKRKEFALKAANNLIRSRESRRRDLRSDQNSVGGALKAWNRRGRR